VAWEKGGEKEKEELMKSLRFGDSWVEALRVLIAARSEEILEFETQNILNFL
jgi:hypothetical protein